jgi:hypothetical protein
VSLRGLFAKLTLRRRVGWDDLTFEERVELREAPERADARERQRAAAKREETRRVAEGDE